MNVFRVSIFFIFTLVLPGFAVGNENSRENVENSQSKVDWMQIKKESLATLKGLIQLDTSQPAGNEIQAAKYIQELLKNEGIDSKIFEALPGRASIVARVKGNGSKKPILLLGHTDVVAVEEENWSFPPFSGQVSDGKIFGRGSADDKGVVAASLHVLIELHRQNIELDRDVIFLGVADEEGGGTYGITYMVEEKLKEIDAEFAINEGGKGSIDSETGHYSSFAIGTAEKTPRRVRLIARGKAGHGSVPTRDNAIAALSRAITRLVESPLPMRLNETSYTYFSRLANSSPESEARVYREILKPHPDIETQEALRDINPSYYSIIRTSVSPTIFQGGYQRNVIPSEAEATLDIRALPGEDPEELLESLRKIIDDASIEILPMKVTRPAHNTAPLDSEMFKAFENVLDQRHPGVLVLPVMLTGATDSAQLRAAGIAAYGFGPGSIVGEDNGVHGNNEFLHLDAFNEYLMILWQVVLEVAAGEGSAE